MLEGFEDKGRLEAKPLCSWALFCFLGPMSKEKNGEWKDLDSNPSKSFEDQIKYKCLCQVLNAKSQKAGLPDWKKPVSYLV